jgi:hypothetical protein
MLLRSLTPGTSVPQTTVGTQPRPLDTAQDVWLPGGATPLMAHGRGVSVPRQWCGRYTGWALGLIGSTGSCPQPLCELPDPPLGFRFIRRRGGD